MLRVCEPHEVAGSDTPESSGVGAVSRASSVSLPIAGKGAVVAVSPASWVAVAVWGPEHLPVPVASRPDDELDLRHNHTIGSAQAERVAHVGLRNPEPLPSPGRCVGVVGTGRQPQRTEPPEQLRQDDVEVRGS